MQEKSRIPVTGVRRLFPFFSGTRRKRILAALGLFFAAVAMAGASLFPGTYPFGIAALGAAGGVLLSLSVLSGAVLGTALRVPSSVSGVHILALVGLLAARGAASVWLGMDGGRDSADRPNTDGKNQEAPTEDKLPLLRQIRAVLLEEEEIPSGSTPGSRVGYGTVLREDIRIRMALSSAAALFAGAWSSAAGGFDPYDLFGAVLSIFIVPLFTYLFCAAWEKSMRSSPIREYGIYAVLAVLTLGLSSLSASLFPLSGGLSAFDLGVLFALMVSSLLPLHYGMHRGAVAGIFCGIASGPAYAPMYALCAVVSSIFCRQPAAFSLVGSGVTAVLWAILMGGLEGFVTVFPAAAVMCALLLPVCFFDLLRLPSDLFGSIPSAKTVKSPAAEIGAEKMKNRLRSLSDGLGSVSAVLTGLCERLKKPPRAELGEIVEQAFFARCSVCPKKNGCREAKAYRASSGQTDLMRAMTDSLAREGFVSAALIPSSLASSCAGMGQILDEVNRAAADRIAQLEKTNSLGLSACDWALAGELFDGARREGTDASEEDRQLSKKLKRILSYHHFGASSITAWGKKQKLIAVEDVDLSSVRMGGDDIRRLMESIVNQPLSQPEFSIDGEAVSMRLRTVNRFQCRSGHYSCAASSVQRYCGDQRSCGAYSDEEGSDAESGPAKVDVTDFCPEPYEVSGDMITDFEADGKYYMILSDGMGSGREAALSSGIATSLLERLIRSGAQLETALKMLNQIIRSTERECSATVDIAEIDLLTGEARFIKSGAAPSFVLRGDHVFRLQSKTIPLGIIRALDAEMIQFDVRQGDTVVMISDGAARSYEEVPWLLDLLSSNKTVREGDERTAAMTVVGEAASRGSKDDITCGILRVRLLARENRSA
ncbi:MAG: SpoIIE family protein phosphatase [Clostridia bacterium]|nr:SpoIIE family protein phosphatase [Clostridia bacterium]